MIGIENVIGKTVITTIGHHIGEVYNVEIDPFSWQITHLQVKLSSTTYKELGLKSRLHRHSMKIPTKLIDNIGVIIKLSQTITELASNLEIKID